ncbi:MAG TPA: hypothetical protein VII56_12780 [Rhizomicrobium sp.]
MTTQAHDDFRVLMTGSSGSGKTTFLAAMYEYLSTIRPETGFFLTESGEHTPLLVREFNKLRNGTFPPPTEHEQWAEMVFTTKVIGGGRTYDACRFTYYDYAGGQFTGDKPNETARAEQAHRALLDSIGHAHSILGMIDGQKLLYAISPPTIVGPDAIRKGVSELLYTDLPLIVEAIQRNEGQPIIHFVISKWDILETAGVTLSQVKKLLLSVEKFRSCLELHPAGATARLIPVSAVGKGFAKIRQGNDPMKFEMVIEPSAQPKPFQVEMPLACVLPDYISVLKREVDAELAEAQKVNTEVRVKSGFLWWRKVLDFAGRAGRTLLPPRIAEGPRAQKLLELLARPAAKSREEAAAQMAELEREKNSIVSGIQGRDDAFHVAALAFKRLATQLNDRFPDSEISFSRVS